MGSLIDKSVLGRLEHAALEAPKLYHATRIVLDDDAPVPGESDCPGAAATDGPGGDGWGEFLGSRKVFEEREYGRVSRRQQSAYYGSRKRLNEYTALAAEARPLLPGIFVEPVVATGVPAWDRDVWTFALYPIGLSYPDRFVLDVFGADRYSRAVEAFPSKRLHWAFAQTAGDGSEYEPVFAEFRVSYAEEFSVLPRYVYATPRLDVFTASVLAVRYLLETQEIYGDRDALTELSRASGYPPARQETVGDGQVRTRNYERDRWIYEKCVTGVLHKTIRTELGLIAKVKGWGVLTTDEGIRRAVQRYTKRQSLPPPHRRKRR